MNVAYMSVREKNTNAMEAETLKYRNGNGDIERF